MDNHTFLVIIDTHSKWLEVIPRHSMSITATIQALRNTFSQLGLPETIASDNGLQFSASEFSQFCHLNGIRYISVPPYHPSSIGLAECAVQTFKEGFKKQSGGIVRDRLSHFLFAYCITLQTSAGISPAELLMGRSLCFRLHLLATDN